MRMNGRTVFFAAAVALLGMLCGCARTTFVTLPERATYPISTVESSHQATTSSEETAEPLATESTVPSSALPDNPARSAGSEVSSVQPAEETAATELPQDTTAETQPPAQEIDLDALAAYVRAAVAGGCTSGAGADGTLDMLAQSWASQYLSSGSSDCAAFLQANGVEAAQCGGNLVIFDLGWTEADMASVFAGYGSTQALCQNGAFTAFGVGAAEAGGVICIGCIFTG